MIILILAGLASIGGALIENWLHEWENRDI